MPFKAFHQLCLSELEGGDIAMELCGLRPTKLYRK